MGKKNANYYLLSCQSRLSHRSNEAHQALKHVEWMN